MHIANTLRLLHLPPEIQADVRSGLLSPAHARVLLTCDTPDEMRELRDRILSEHLSVREAEERVEPRSDHRASTPRRRTRRKTVARSQSPLVRDVEDRLQRAYGTAVQIHERAGRGRVTLEFFSMEDLTRLADLLLLAESSSPRGVPASP